MKNRHDNTPGDGAHSRQSTPTAQAGKQAFPLERHFAALDRATDLAEATGNIEDARQLLEVSIRLRDVSMTQFVADLARRAGAIQ